MSALPPSDSQRGRIQTVLGPIDPDDLGPTLMHEHLLWDIRPPDWKVDDPGPEISLENHWEINYGEAHAPGNVIMQDADVAIAELRKLHDDGGRAVVELSCGGLSPDAEGLARTSKASNVHVIMGCGHYVDEYQAVSNQGRSVESFAQEMIEQVQSGAWGSSIRAGIIGEIGCQSPWTDLEKRVMAGAAIAQRETGASISVHPGRHPDQPDEVTRFLREAGADLARVVISHVDRTIFDEERLFRLADTGCVIEYDLFGMETTFYKFSDIDMPNDGRRLEWLRKLADRGHLAQIVVSHDICYRTRLSAFGGHGYGHIFRNVIPLMRRRGFSEAEIRAITCDNPRRLLTIV